MVLKPPDVLDEDDLTDADAKILDALHDGPLTKGAIVDRTGLHRNTVGGRLDVLDAGDAVEAVHDRTALYRLVDDPRADVEPAPDVATLQERIDDLEASLVDAREDRQAYKERLGECRDRLADAPDRQELRRAIEDLEHALANGGMDVDVALARLREAAGVTDDE